MTRPDGTGRHFTAFAAATLVAAAAMAGCTTNASSGTASGTAAGSGSPTATAGNMAVQATDTSCGVSTATAPSGNLVFNVTNGGSKVTEFYLLASDGLRIVGEVENIGPGISRNLVVQAPPGSYFTACKPGMVGDGIRAAFIVTDSGADLTASGDDQQLVTTANTLYAAYLRDQTEQLVAVTNQFVKLYEAGKDDEARALYPTARAHYERIEPVAESFGDLDPKLDFRQADVEKGDRWTGWHVIEKDLWPPHGQGYKEFTAAQRKEYSDLLVKNTAELYKRTRTMSFSATEIANGSQGLMDEVATGKVTGEEEIRSHTDLYDFQANMEGARIGFEGLRPLLKKKNPTLDSQIDARFTALQTLLDKYRTGDDGFQLYIDLTKPQIKQLSDAVNALAEPLSKLSGAVTL
ncbi:MAG TPA: iron uptake system protein EfeO [Actinopolymorphaceae bacterium]|jgi:iron uptake system component EfeO